MTHVLTIARREVSERRFVLVAAVTFALVPLIVAALPLQGDRSERLAVTSVIFSVGFTLGLAAVLGSSVVGNGLTTGRLSFFFTRPVSGAAIWFGKLLGSLFLIAASFFIAVSPILLVRDQWRHTWNANDGAGSVVVLCVAFALFLVAHALSTMIRSRSWVIAIDFVAFTGAVALLAMIVQPLVFSGPRLVGELMGFVTLASLLAVCVAAAWQLHRGRTDRVRSHVVFSTALWSMVAVCLAIAASVALWVRSASPAALKQFSDGFRTRNSSVVYLAGTTNRLSARAAYLADAKSGRWRQVPAAPSYAMGSVSADGSTFAFMDFANLTDLVRGRGDRFQLVAGSTSGSGKQRVLGTVAMNFQLGISPDGRYVGALSRDAAVTVYDVRAEKMLGSVKLPIPSPTDAIDGIEVANDGTALIIAGVPAGKRPTRLDVNVFRYTPASRQLQSVMQFPVWGRFMRWTVSNDGSRALVRIYRARNDAPPADLRASFVVLDLAGGRISAQLVGSSADARLSSAWVLTDGRMAAIEWKGADAENETGSLRLFDAAGAPLHSSPLPQQTVATIEGEYAPGKIVVTSWGGNGAAPGGWIAAVDADSGRVLRSAKARALSGNPHGFGIGTVNAEVATYPADREFALWNANTGQMTPVRWQ